MTPKKLLYVTLAYPADLYSEKVFVDSEIPALLQEFNQIVLVPTDPFPRHAAYEKMLPEGVSADWSLADDKIYSSKLLKTFYIFHPAVIRAIFDMRREARSPRQWLKGFFQAANMVRASQIVRRVARAHDMSPADTVLYSMWFADPASGLARLAMTDGWKMATRAHTSDLYDDRMLFRSKKLRSRLLRFVSNVFAISEKGARYMKSRYPEADERILHHPLGARRSGPPDSPPKHSSDSEISFVTTARLDPVKSLPLILDTLAEVARRTPDRNIIWTLIGDGPCLEHLVEQAENIHLPNFSVDFKGAMPNDLIQHFYATDRPDWFIMMSRSEGLPISMGEAMAHAIPVITTDVGDVAELVGDDCAILVPAPYDADGNRTLSPAQYADIITQKVTDAPLRNAMATAAANRWATTFDATRLAQATARKLSSLLQ